MPSANFQAVLMAYKDMFRVCLIILLGGNGEREIPDPISNSEVKPLIADGTAHKSVGE